MGAVNVLACGAAFIAVTAATALARRVWVDLTVAGQLLSGPSGPAVPSAASVGLVYLGLFCAVGLGLTALLRAAKPAVWAAAFGLAYAAYWLHSSDVLLLYSGAKLFTRLSIEVAAPVAGCVLGALASRWLRRLVRPIRSQVNPADGPG